MGNGLTNLPAMPAGAHVVDITSPRKGRLVCWYKALAMDIGLHYHWSVFFCF